MNHAEPEEKQHTDKGKRREVGDMLHGDIGLPAYGFAFAGIAFELARCKADGLTDDTAALYNADNAGHGDTADAYHACIFRENLAGPHGGDFSRAVGTHKRNYEPPYENRAGENHEGIFQTHDISQTEYGGAAVA